MSSEPEKRLREIWNAKGVPPERQEELLQQIADAGRVGARVGPFTVRERRKPEQQTALDLD